MAVAWSQLDEVNLHDTVVCISPRGRVVEVVLELRHPQKEELLMLCVLLCAYPPHPSNPHGQETGPPRGEEGSLCFLLRPSDSCPSPSGLTSTGNLRLHVR